MTIDIRIMLVRVLLHHAHVIIMLHRIVYTSIIWYAYVHVGIALVRSTAIDVRLWKALWMCCCGASEQTSPPIIYLYILNSRVYIHKMYMHINVSTQTVLQFFAIRRMGHWCSLPVFCPIHGWEAERPQGTNLVIACKYCFNIM